MATKEEVKIPVYTSNQLDATVTQLCQSCHTTWNVPLRRCLGVFGEVYPNPEMFVDMKPEYIHYQEGEWKDCIHCGKKLCNQCQLNLSSLQLCSSQLWLCLTCISRQPKLAYATVLLHTGFPRNSSDYVHIDIEQNGAKKEKLVQERYHSCFYPTKCKSMFNK